MLAAGRLSHAEERFTKARMSNPHSARPILRLALVESLRGHLAESAKLIREAQFTEPDWIHEADDLRLIIREPTELDALIESIEREVQFSPADRDAWLVLGALQYLAGRLAAADDVFSRLADRPRDRTVRAFVEALEETRPQR